MLVTILCGCGSGAGGGGGSPAAVLLSQLPSPLPQSAPTGQEMTSADVAAGTPADPARLAVFLGSTSFADAYSRVWTQGPNYVTLLAISFDHAPDATAMVQFEVQQLTNAANTFVEPHTAIPGSYVFVIHGPTRVGGTPVNCEGVWLPVKRFAVETLTCSAQGAWATAAEDLALQERNLVQQVGG